MCEFTLIYALELTTLEKGKFGNKTLYWSKSAARDVLFRHITVHSLDPTLSEINFELVYSIQT